jgi:hypothetical protein
MFNIIKIPHFAGENNLTRRLFALLRKTMRLGDERLWDGRLWDGRLGDGETGDWGTLRQ